MSVWGSGLYSGDFAMDLRTTVSAVARLPFDGDRLVDLLCDVEPTVANNPEDEDYTTFWLVVADQFAKRGIVCERVKEQALQIIDRGNDIAMVTKLGMDSTGLKKRQAMLADLRHSLTTASTPTRQRSVLKKPQPFLMDTGDVLVYPTTGGECINPYYPSKERMIPAWHQDGWSAVVIVERGRAFDFLAWYRPLTITDPLSEKPDLTHLRSTELWILRPPGTCSTVHFKRMELEILGVLPVDTPKFNRCFPHRNTGQYQAVNDVSIANQLEVGPSIPAYLIPRPGQAPLPSPLQPYPSLSRLDDILC